MQHEPSFQAFVGLSSPRSTPDHRQGPRIIVREGWIPLSKVHRPPHRPSDRFGHIDLEYIEWIRPLLDGVPRGSQVFDLGCGSEVPAARALSERSRGTCADISEVEIRRARGLVPTA
jgi:hypothetical protein